MAITDNKETYIQLRKLFPVFTYRNFFYSVKDEHLSVIFDFNISDKYFFNPELHFDLKRLSGALPAKNVLDNLIFNLGMIELISYWKLSCSPLLVIKPNSISDQQIAFWKKLYYHGLGEFFYTNSIDAGFSDFMHIECDAQKSLPTFISDVDKNKVLVPVGGGKDSSVSLNLLKKHFELTPFIVNPRGASLETASVKGFDKSKLFIVNRTLDPLLLKLNAQGFLNGHTPFSALLGFAGLLAATLNGSKYIALSNESSANEPTVKDGPNHQYSKSYEFERDFRDYVKTYITNQIEYFSFLRPLSELQISHLFAQNSAFFPFFISCNVGSKTDSWCGKCPKCLFTYIILSPFIQKQELIHIFGHDLFQSESLLPTLEELAGIREVKPFECVGTIDEVNLALSLAIERHPEPLPPILKRYNESGKKIHHPENLLIKQLGTLDDMHAIPDQFLNILLKAIHAH